MSKDTLKEFGPESSSGPRSPNGGQVPVKTINYSPPVGPKGIGDPKSPGLHGSNHGNCGTQRKS